MREQNREEWVRAASDEWKTVCKQTILTSHLPPLKPTWLLPLSPSSPLEPMLFPKLRIHFADFPDSHSSIDQRLHTLETCCGYEYDQIQN